MYKPLTYHTDLGDIEIIEHEGRLHLFHLVTPNRDLIGHAVSDDGLSWKALPPAIRTGDPGQDDDDMIRTVSVTKRNDLFYMLYTATSRRFMDNGLSEGGRVERVGLAVSKDLCTWEKRYDVPFIQANPAYYEDSFGATRVVSFRDPKPYGEDGKYYCVIAARENEGPLLRRGCVALYTSDDLVNWEAKAPLFAPRLFFDIECPQIYKIGNKYYLWGSIVETKSQKYWVSDKLEGPYQAPPKDDIMPPASHYAARIGQFNEEDILCCWNYSIEDGPSPYGLIPNRGERIKYVPSPLKVNQSGDGALTLASFKGWEQYRLHKPERIRYADNGRHVFANRYAEIEENTLRVQSGMDCAVTEQRYEDFMLEGTVILNGPRGGIAFHLQEDTSGYFVELIPHEFKVRLVKHFCRQRLDQSFHFDYEVRQENSFDLSGVRQEGVSFLLRAVNGEIEFGLGGCVLLSTVSTTATAGKIGMFVDSGSIRMDHLRVTRMKRPLNL